MASWVSRLFRPSSSSLGLDLADPALRMVELHDAGGLVLAWADSQPLAPDCVVDGQIQQFDALVLALRQLLQRHHPATRELAMALPAAAVRRATWSAPVGLKDDALHAWVQAQTALQWPAEQALSVDYGVCPLRSCGAGLQADGVEVWVAAAALDAVQDRQGLAEACGLRLMALDDAAAAAERALHRAAAARGLAQTTEGLADAPFLFEGLRLGAGLKAWPAQSSSYATAYGLALRAFTP